MKLINCDEMELAIVQLGAVDVHPYTAKQINQHIDQCESCSDTYAHFRPALLNGKFSDKFFSTPDINVAFWDKLPAKVLAQVNELKADIGLKQNAAVIDMADFRPELKLVSAGHGKPYSTRQRFMLSIAASVLIVVAVVMVIQKPLATFQHHADTFQLSLSKASNLSEIVKQIEIKDTPTALFSFATQARPPSGFMVGSYYAESLAKLDAIDIHASRIHLQALYAKMSASAGVDEMSRLLQKTIEVDLISANSRADRMKAIALFSKRLVGYLSQHNPDELVYFRLGLWTVNMALAAKINSTLVRDEVAQVDYFISSLSARSAPLGILKNLKDMRGLIDQPIDTVIDSKALFRANRKLRQLLM